MVIVYCRLVIILYVAMVVYVSCQHHRRKSENFDKIENTLIQIFSLKTNWKKLSISNDRPNFQKLKFIQGLRFYNMLLVIFCHTTCSYINGYVSSTEYIELAYRNQIRLFMATLFVFLVQTFFLISAFFLSYHVCQSMEVYRDSKLRYIVVTLLNRYLRLLPPVFVMVFLCKSSWVAGIFQGPVKSFYVDREYERCQKNWWANILFVNNHYDYNNMCYLITWYLSADTQLYLMSLLIMLIIWKFRQRTKIVLILVIFIGIMIPAFMCYKYGLDMIYRITPENSKTDKFRTFKFNAVYTSTYANMASYMVGLAIGRFYFALDKGNVTLSGKHLLLLKCVFCTLPIAIILISSQEYSRTITIVLIGLVKPLYALGIGAGILAMSQQKTDLVKTVCELPWVLFLGNFTYSTYVVQFGIVFYRTAAAYEPYFLSDSVLLTSFFQDVVLSIFCGFLMHIFLEMPALQLQKMFVPQIRHISSSKQK
ncbi:unnamed protein product [Ceutorhynchus assimilis]|uniref:Acyltransferase 3 domain-containing protein n=1 Tax=Ceutorhynchus assimilis TaxID=467358 RepID=A0A9N9QNE2_9CUCU|nr:unnamed protein product [Ceutorhynchus assimilis]